VGGAAGGSCYKDPLLWCWSNLQLILEILKSLLYFITSAIFLMCSFALLRSLDPSFFMVCFPLMHWSDRLLKMAGGQKWNGNIQSNYALLL